MANYSSPNNYQALLDMLNPEKKEELFTPMIPTAEQLSSPVNPTPEQLAELTQPEPMAEMPAQPVAKTAPAAPKKDQLSAPAQDDSSKPPMQDTPLSKSEALIAEYNKMLGRDQEALAEARKTDRMLKVGGALGDALATYLNAKSQMNVKAPGVQVQQGAGLDKVAEMFATAPSIQSDIAQRREALMKQYAELAKGERAQAQLDAQKELARDRAKLERDLLDRRLAAESKIAGMKATKEATDKSEKPTVGEQTVDREFAKKYNEWRTGGEADYKQNKIIFDEAIKALEDKEIQTGTLAGIGANIPGIRTEARQLETRVRKALNSMLRATLGAQFTENEGERIFEQTFDPSAPSTENIKNMKTELKKIEKRARDIAIQGDYFTKNKTLSQFPTEKLEIEDKIQNVLEANPGSNRKQVIDALKKDKKLPPDYE